MNVSRGKAIVAMLLTGLAGLFTLGAGVGAGWAQSAEPLKIGAVFDISGRASFYGSSHRDSAQLAVEQINAGGGINGRPLQLTVYDGESDETKALLAFRRLIDQDKVLALLGPSLTGQVLAAADTLRRAEVMTITPGAGIKVIEPVKPWIFSISQGDRFAVAKGLSWLASQNVKRLVVLAESSALGTGGRDEIKSQVEKFGITIVANETFGDKDVDVTPQLTAIRSRQFDAVIVWGSSTAAAIAGKNARQLGIKVPILFSPGVVSQAFLDIAGPTAETEHFIITKLVAGDRLPDSDPAKAIILRFISSYKEKYHHEPDQFGANLYDAVYVLADALKRAGPDRKAIRDAVEQTNKLLSVSGYISFGPERHYGVDADNYIVGTVKNARFVPAD
jgi:branched-chain amino acid transport system substrate-binding protein